MSSIGHNSIWNITAELLTEVCPNVGMKPTLQPLNGEVFHRKTTNTEDNARLDIKAKHFWDSSRWSTFFDVRVFNAHTPSNSSFSFGAYYRRHERKKRRNYEQLVIEVEYGTFTPLVPSSNSGWRPSATVRFKRLANLISQKYGQLYSSTLYFIRCRITFSLIHSAVACLRGPRSSFHAPARETNLIDHALGFIHSEIHPLN